MIHQENIELLTQHRGFYNLDKQINSIIETASINVGLCHVYIPHTSASVIITENWDSTVLKDLEAFMSRLVVDGDAIFKHTLEGPDDMPAHVRSALTQTAASIPIVDHQLALGTWQGIFLWEHRFKPHQRKVIITLAG